MPSQATWFQRLYSFGLRSLANTGNKLLLVELGDNNPHIEEPALAPGYSTRALEPEDLMPWASAEYQLSPAFLNEAQARGDRCVGNFYADQLVGYGFVTQSFAAITDQIGVKINQPLLYRYKGWTHPEHRRKYLSHARGRLNSRLFPQQPGQRMVSYVDAHNFPSRLKHADIRPVRLGYCLILRLFGKEFCINSRIAKRYGFSLVRNNAVNGS